MKEIAHILAHENFLNSFCGNLELDAYRFLCPHLIQKLNGDCHTPIKINITFTQLYNRGEIRIEP